MAGFDQHVVIRRSHVDMAGADLLSFLRAAYRKRRDAGEDGRQHAARRRADRHGAARQRTCHGSRRMSYGTCFPRWREGAPAWEAYVHAPFVHSLANGSLPRGTFLTYLAQDYLFLVHFARAWSLAVTKAGTLS